jgi:hypothetical protein
MALFTSRFTASSGKVTPMARCEHTRDPANEHMCDEQIKLCERAEMNENGLTLVLSTPSLMGAGWPQNSSRPNKLGRCRSGC